MRATLQTMILAAGLVAPAAPIGAALRVVATTPDYGALAQAIGGEHVKVTILAKSTEDPHFVDPRPSHIVALNRADVLIESGAELEIGWLPPLVEGARNPRLLHGAPGRVYGADGIEMLDVPAILDRSQGDVHARGNPHFLMDPRNAEIVARRLAERLCSLDPDSCPAFRANLDRFLHALQRKLEEWSRLLEPFRGTAVVTYHNTWRYFARRFGLDADLFLEPKPGIPPSPPHLARVIETMQRQGIRVILVEPFQSRRTAEAVAERAGAIVVEVCQFPGGLPGTEGDYLALMDANVRAIVAGLTAGAGGR